MAGEIFTNSATLSDCGVTEDTLACLRDAIDFKNVLLVELPNGDWAQTILRQFFSVLSIFSLPTIQNSKNALLALSRKSAERVTYLCSLEQRMGDTPGDGIRREQKIATLINMGYTGKCLAASYELGA